jgi:UrcA family protein
MNTITTSTSLRALIAAAIFGALASGITAVSAAADGTELRSTVVKYGDLNVSNPQAAAALYSRIRKAAESVCSVSTGANYAATIGVSPCVHKAIAESVAAVNQPALFAVYNAKNKTPLPVMVAGGQAR